MFARMSAVSRPLAILLASLAAMLAGCSRKPPPAASAPDAAEASPKAVADPAENARRVVGLWTDAENRHDAAALAALYDEHVRSYGHDAAKTRVLRDKSAALAKVPTFHQEIVGPIAVQADGARLIASFIKRSGPAAKLRDVGAKLVLVLHDPLPLIVEETDDPSEEPAAQRRREECEAVAAEVVNELPEVKKRIAALNVAIDQADSGAAFGGIGPTDDGAGGFQVGIGVHTAERFEETIGYQVDSSGWLAVSAGGAPIALPTKARAAIRHACRSPPPSCVAKRGANEAEEDAMLAALFPHWDAKSRRARVASGHVVDCYGHDSDTEWVGEEPDADLSAGQVRIKGRQSIDAERAFYFVATGLHPGACAGENGFLVLARASKDKVVIEASSAWGVDCNAHFALRPLAIRGGVVYQEDVGRFGTGAGFSEDDPVWVVDPPELRVARRFSVESDPDCPMTDDQECPSSEGDLHVSDAGTLVYRSTAQTATCSLSKDSGPPVCRNRKTTTETDEYVLEEAALVEVPRAK
jgi:hypothetical protein